MTTAVAKYATQAVDQTPARAGGQPWMLQDHSRLSTSWYILPADPAKVRNRQDGPPFIVGDPAEFHCCGAIGARLAWQSV